MVRLFQISVLSGALLSTAASASQVPPPLVPVIENRNAIAASFASTIVQCVTRKDTSNPVFHGCIDWHSAVHGVWALLAYDKASASGKYSAVLSSILSDEGLREEGRHLISVPRFEMPYGRSWFLRLAIDDEKATNSALIDSIAEVVASSLLDYYSKHTIDPESGAYQSASWALINLVDYARAKKKPGLEARAIALVKENFLKQQARCRGGSESGEFMAVCTNWAALVARVLPRSQYETWLEHFLDKSPLRGDFRSDETDHEAGLDFSYAWGLWDMYSKSNRPELAEAYAEHFNAGLKAKRWMLSYAHYGHWVAQFGMFALQPTFGEMAGR